MTRTQALSVVLACVLLLAWLTGSGRMAVPHAAADPGQAVRLAPDSAVEAITRQTARLRDHLSAPAPLPPSRRNPFQFHDVAPPRAHAALPKGVPAPGEGALAAQPPRPVMQLQGIAEDRVDGATVRKAVLSVGGELFIAGEGDRVLGRYEVVRVTADAVLLKDGEETFTLALR